VVENEDAGCSGSEMVSCIDRLELKHCIHVLEQLLCLGIVATLNFLVINKLFLIHALSVDLEAAAIKSVLFLSTSHIAHCHRLDVGWSIISLWAIDVGWVGWRAVFVGLVVVQHGVDILRSGLGGGGQLGGLWGVCRGGGGVYDCGGGHVGFC
jgi:hypothetical protein